MSMYDLLCKPTLGYLDFGKTLSQPVFARNTAHATLYFLLETVDLRAEYPYLWEQNKYVKL